jgi:RNA polymerase sigma-70 factor (ECF subfamily)
MTSWLHRIEADRERHLRFVRGRVSNGADAEDVLQRALLRAVSRADTLSDEARAESWFFRILRRAIADHGRARRADEARVSPDETAIDRIPTAPPAEKTCACGGALLDQLRPDYAEMIRRVDVKEESIRDVARALGISPANAHVRLHRARRALRDRIEVTCGVHTTREALACECACSA